MQEITQDRSPCDEVVHVAGSDGSMADHNAAYTLQPVSEGDGLELLEKVVRHDAIRQFRRDGYPPPNIPSEPIDKTEQILRAWVNDPEKPSPIMWLSVAHGIKTSKAAEKVINVGWSSDRFAATFFFHPEQGGDQGRSLLPTIAYQLANNLEEFHTPINRIVLQNTALLDEAPDISAQFQSLIVRPFQESNSIPLRSHIVAIIGLDEFGDPESELEVLNLIASAVKKHELPLRFLISSRAKAYSIAFASEPLISCSSTILLSDSISVSTQSSDPSRLPHSDSSSHPILRHLLPSKKGRRNKLHQNNRPTPRMESFPRLVTVQRSNGQAESYTRSLMMTGHGFPLWYPCGDLGKPIEYLRRGIGIGDVGVLDRDGLFDFCFNIFLDADDPIHSVLVPREFKPVEGGLHPSEIRSQPHYFHPGTVIASKGITVTRHSESPLELSFASTEQEGGIIVLPNGASREDMVKTERIHEYTKRHAPYWYQDVNGYGGVVHTNGSLFIVTGCDKTDNWAIASFPYYAGSKTPLQLQYTHQPDFESPWTDRSTARTSSYAPSTSKSLPDSKHQCIFVRGMRISLSTKSWEETMPVTRSAKLYYTYILHTPSSLEMLMNSVLVYLRLRLSERRALKKVTPNRIQLFHPNYIIGQVLLQDHPDSDVALVDDLVWCSLTHENLCTISEVNNLVTAVFEQNDIVEKDGVVSLVSKTEGDYGMVPKSLFPPRRTLSWASLPLLPKFLKQISEKKDIPWVQDIPVSEHAKLF